MIFYKKKDALKFSNKKDFILQTIYYGDNSKIMTDIDSVQFDNEILELWKLNSSILYNYIYKTNKG